MLSQKTGAGFQQGGLASKRVLFDAGVAGPPQPMDVVL